jgi:hypothetical protein
MVYLIDGCREETVDDRQPAGTDDCITRCGRGFFSGWHFMPQLLR